MSAVIEKSLSELFNSVLGIGSSSSSSSQSTQGLKSGSLGLVTFVERMEAARKISKQEEEELFYSECQEWMKQISHQTLNRDVIADILCRALIAFSRGHYSSDLQIHAINLTQSDNITHKKIGSLYISTTMPPGSDLAILMVNTLQRSLSSMNILEISIGLNLLPTILSLDTSLTVGNCLISCLRHQEPIIRKKALNMVPTISLSSYEQKNFYDDLQPHLLHLLADVDPSVAIAATISLSKLYQKLESDSQEEEEIRDKIAKSCAHLLLQAVEGSLPIHYNIGPCKAPFVQVQILKAIQNISNADWDIPELLVSSIEVVLSQQLSGRELSLYMVLLEGVRTVTFLPKKDSLISEALKVILGFLRSSIVDFKYLGVKALMGVFSVIKDSLTKSHLEAVLDCLYHSDTLLQSKSIRLLCFMSNQHNYQIICNTLLEFSFKTQNFSLRERVMDYTSEILRRCCCDVRWCLAFLSIIIKSSDCNQKFLQTLSHVTIKALNANKNLNEDLMQDCEDIFKLILNLESPSIHHLFTVITIINELLSLRPESVRSSNIIALLEKLNSMHVYDFCEVFFECWTKCALHIPELNNKIVEFLSQFEVSSNYSTRLKVKEALLLLRNAETAKHAMKLQNKILAKDYTPDLSLTFCDKYVTYALQKDEKPYFPFSFEKDGLARSLKSHSKKSETRASSPTFLSLDPPDTPTSESLPFCSIFASHDDVPLLNRSLESPKWTAKGRQVASPPHDDEEVVSQVGQSLMIQSSAVVEIAAEADEASLKSLELEASPRSAPSSLQDNRRADLTQALFRSLWISKES